MILVETHDFRPGSKDFKKLANLLHLSKNLYNATLYAVRQHFFATGKFLSNAKVNKTFITRRDVDYYALPTKVSQQTQRLVDQNFKSFFAARKAGLSSARLPRYLPKDGYQVAMFTNQALSFGTRTVREGHLRLSGVDLVLKTRLLKVKFARVVHKGSFITVELGHEVEPQPRRSGGFAGLDLGVNNLATIAFENRRPLIVNGRPVKSVNQFFNKTMAKLRSRQDSTGVKRTTRRMNGLSRWRTTKLNDYLHKSSRHVVNQLVTNNVATLVVGYNQGWKQGTTMGAVNNQKFVSIPFTKFVSMLTYKCELAGIDVVVQQESHTSKCSFLDHEDVGHHEEYVGRRVKRGLFKTATGKLVNADVNGALNILKKYLVKVAVDVYQHVNTVAACSTPSVFTVNT